MAKLKGGSRVYGNITIDNDITSVVNVTATGNVAVDGAFRAESSNSTERFEVYYNETTDSLDFDYLTA